MDFKSAMESFAEAWLAAAASANSTAASVGLFSPMNGPSQPTQSQPLSLTANSNSSLRNSSPNENAAHNNGGVKTISIRCVVESVANVQNWQSIDGGYNAGRNHSSLSNGVPHIELDRRTSIPAHTVFHNLLEAVLLILGYPKEAVSLAKGAILIENWRPIRLEKLPENPQKTVNDILGQINSFVTLKIQILRSSGCSNVVLTQMKEKLLQVLILQNKEHIFTSGCPLDQITLKNVLRCSEYPLPIPPEEMVRKFDQWVSNQYRQQALRPMPAYPTFAFHLTPPAVLHHDKRSSLSSPEERVHPALQTVHSQYPTQKTRMRTSFDPELELPKLHKWFSENQHPSRQQIQTYVNDLNDLESRKGRKPLDINNVVYWFKNARAAQKRAEVRNVGTGGTMNSLNGYRSDSHSPCDTAITSKGSVSGSVHSCDEEADLAEDEQEDDDDDDDEEEDADDDEEEEDDDRVRGGHRATTDDEGLNNKSFHHHQQKQQQQQQHQGMPPDSPVAPLQLTTKNNQHYNRNNDNNNHHHHQDSGDGNGNGNNKEGRHRNQESFRQNDSSPTLIKQEPPDKDDVNVRDNVNVESKNGADRITDSEEEDMDEDLSEADSVAKSPPSAIFRHHNSSPLSLIPSRSAILPTPGGFPSLVPNSMFSQSFMYMSQYLPNLAIPSRNPIHPSVIPPSISSSSAASLTSTSPQSHNAANHHSSSSTYSDDRRKRNRTFIDPVTEVPCLERWFCMNTHPSHGLILQYTEDLNSMPYRQKFPRLEPKNVQFWFKNRRAKCKRLKTSLYDNMTAKSLSIEDQYHELSAALSVQENYRGGHQD